MEEKELKSFEREAYKYASSLKTNSVRLMCRLAFKAGAEWMLEKACEYMKNQYPAHYQDYQEWVELADEYVKQFKKAMEE